MAAEATDTLGSRLEEARKRKGVSLREAAEATKIRMAYLSQFESDDFDLPLPPIYQRGFVKIYARYLGEDADWFAAELQARLNRFQAGGPRGDVRASLGQMDLASRGRRGSQGEGGQAAAVSVEDTPGEEKAGGWKIPSVKMPSFRSPGRREEDGELDDFEESGEGMDRTFYLKVAVIVGSVTVAVVLLIALAKLVFGGDEREAPLNPELASEQTSGGQAEILGQSAGRDEAAAGGAGEIVLRATGGPTWVQLESTADGELIGRASLAAGESRRFPAEGEVLVMFTQGENLEVERGGERFAPTGAGAGKIRIQ